MGVKLFHPPTLRRGSSRLKTKARRKTGLSPPLKFPLKEEDADFIGGVHFYTSQHVEKLLQQLGEPKEDLPLRQSQPIQLSLFKSDRFQSFWASPYLYLDLETTGLDVTETIRLITIGDEETTHSFDTRERYSDVLELLKNKPVIGHNLKFDLKFLFHKYNILPPVALDTMVAHQIVNCSEGKKSSAKLGDIAYQYLGINMDKSLRTSDWSATLSEEQLEYAREDVDILKKLKPVLVDKLNRLEPGKILLETKAAKVIGLKNPVAILEMRFLPEIVKMELNGLPIDTTSYNLQELKNRYNSYCDKFVKQHHANPFSPIESKKVLSTELKTQIPNTSASTLSAYQNNSVVKELTKIRNTKKEVDKVEEFLRVSRDGRIHSEFWQIGAVSGRMSSSSPNVQNISPSLRKLFRASPGKKFLIADFPSIELRLASVIADDKRMQDAFRRGKDLHQVTASQITGKPTSEVTSEERKLAKGINFGLIYGMSANGLMKYALQNFGVSMDYEEAQRYKAIFFKTYSGIAEWQRKLRYGINLNGEIATKTLLGRQASANTLYTACNYPVQGSGADLLKLSVIDLSRKLKQSGLEAWLINLIHDEIVLEVEGSDMEQVKNLLKQSLESTCFHMLGIPTPIEVIASDRAG